MKLDLAADELVEDTTILPIRRRYEDQKDGRCRVYTLEEITAEKLRCVMQRLQCRDLHDLYELLVVNDIDAEALWPLFERKARHLDRALLGAKLGSRPSELADAIAAAEEEQR